MPHLFDYAPQRITEWSLRKQSSEFGISFRAAVQMKLRYAVEAAEIWADAFEPYYWQWVAAIIKLRGMKDVERKGGITDNMIEQAREIDIRSVVDFERGKALAWCHEDKNPSLTYMSRTNKAWCAACGKYFDPIAVMMERDGTNFPDAVRKLCN